MTEYGRKVIIDQTTFGPNIHIDAQYITERLKRHKDMISGPRVHQNRTAWIAQSSLVSNYNEAPDAHLAHVR